MSFTGNTRRLTAARFYLGFAVVALVFSLLALKMRGGRESIAWIDYPTALGDGDFYTELGEEDDRYQPNLTWEGFEGGLFRQTEEPVEMDDSKMGKLARELKGRVTVYRPLDGGKKDVVYLKAADGLYFPFGGKTLYDPEAWPEDSSE